MTATIHDLPAVTPEPATRHWADFLEDCRSDPVLLWVLARNEPKFGRAVRLSMDATWTASQR